MNVARLTRISQYTRITLCLGRGYYAISLAEIFRKICIFTEASDDQHGISIEIDTCKRYTCRGAFNI